MTPSRAPPDADPARQLRVCLLVRAGRPLRDWQAMVIDQITADPKLAFAGLLERTDLGPGKKRSSILFSAASALERAVLARSPAYLPRETIGAAGRVRANFGNIGLALATLRCDVVVNCTSERLLLEVLEFASFGEWRFNFEDEVDGHSDWFGIDPILKKAPSVDLVLVANRARGGEQRIASAAFNIKPSGARNNAATKERAVTLLMRELRQVQRTGAMRTEAGAIPVGATPPNAATTGRYIVGLARETGRRLRDEFRTRYRHQPAIWTLFTGQGGIDTFDPAQSIEIPPAARTIRADPFLFERGGETYLFYESYAPGDHKAHIAVSRFDGDTLHDLGPAIEVDHHLSYPFVFRDGDSIYMMPEIHQAKRIEVWKCVDFPLKWQLHATAFEGRSAADSVMIQQDGAWWLFTNLSDFHAYEDHCSELYVFRVDGPDLRQITAHSGNPVVIGGTYARNGGRILARDGRLFRPSQRNEFGVYGYGLNVMEITRLTLDEYEETCLRTIAPDFKPGIFGCHHFDGTGDRYIIDARVIV